MSRRDQIRLSEEEMLDYLKTSRTMIMVSNGKNGYPHPMPMWFAVGDDKNIYMTTFKKSQKINNELKRKIEKFCKEEDDHKEDAINSKSKKDSFGLRVFKRFTKLGTKAAIEISKRV